MIREFIRFVGWQNIALVVMAVGVGIFIACKYMVAA